MSRKAKLYRDAILAVTLLCATVLLFSALNCFLWHKPITLTGGIGEILSAFLSFLWIGNLFLYRPRTLFQRIVSFLFLFTTDFSKIAVEQVSRHRRIDFSAAIHVAVLTAIVMGVVAWVRRRYDRKAKAVAQTPAATVTADLP